MFKFPGIMFTDGVYRQKVFYVHPILPWYCSDNYLINTYATIYRDNILKMIYLCLQSSQFHKTLQIISLLPTVLSECIKILLAEVVKKVKEL